MKTTLLWMILTSVQTIRFNNAKDFDLILFISITFSIIMSTLCLIKYVYETCFKIYTYYYHISWSICSSKLNFKAVNKQTNYEGCSIETFEDVNKIENLIKEGVLKECPNLTEKDFNITILNIVFLSKK